ncbi:DNA polymerase IV [Roseivirga sp. BDSF3-8]|uniref:DNA polymerase IV n=1 Tax=Roseivirga sp. BDSF3-8 TaxID=3241598 RepID=UPI00353258DC
MDTKEAEDTPYRKIIHVDMDAFYASVEQRDHPELRGKPVAVGGSKRRGVVAAASYEARRFGIHSAMPSAIAARKCPNLIFVKSRFDVYREVSHQIREIFYEYTDLVEPLSLDEAYLDVTENKPGIPSATLIAREIKKRIKQQTRLTASAGISMNKFLAKIASDYRKPDGIFLIHPVKAEAFVEQLPIEKFHGIGKATAAKMHSIGIFHGKDLKQYTQEELVRRFGKSGRHYFNISRAIDHREVNPNRIRKSMSAERTFDEDLEDLPAMKQAMDPIIDKVYGLMKDRQIYGKTVTIKVKFSDFELITRSKTVHTYIQSRNLLQSMAFELLEQVDREPLAVRLLGVGISNLNINDQLPGYQLTLEF